MNEGTGTKMIAVVFRRLIIRIDATDFCILIIKKFIIGLQNSSPNYSDKHHAQRRRACGLNLKLICSFQQGT
jgi:hypothetical protein